MYCRYVQRKRVLERRVSSRRVYIFITGNADLQFGRSFPFPVCAIFIGCMRLGTMGIKLKDSSATIDEASLVDVSSFIWQYFFPLPDDSMLVLLSRLILRND